VTLYFIIRYDHDDKYGDNDDNDHDHHLGISSIPRSAATALASITVPAVATNVIALAVQALQLFQPLYQLIMALSAYHGPEIASFSLQLSLRESVLHHAIQQ